MTILIDTNEPYFLNYLGKVYKSIRNISSYTKSKVVSYSFFIGALRKLNILLNKKILSNLIIFDRGVINFLIYLSKSLL